MRNDNRRDGGVSYVFQFGQLWDRWPDFLGGAALTIYLASVSTVIGMLAGGVLAVLRAFGPRAVRWLAGTYVELVRNTPLLVQLYLVYFALPKAGLRLDSNQAALLALSLNLAAYACEIVRAGLESTGTGPVEAGLSLGLSRWQVIRGIVLPPALRAIHPALGSQFVLQILGSSLVSAIAAEELTAISNNVMMQTFRNFEVFLIAGALYLVMGITARLLFGASARLLYRW